MKLIDKKSGKQININDTVTIETGVNKGQRICLSKLVEPTDNNMFGFVEFNRKGKSWQQLYPFVIGAKWICNGQ